jgi:NADH-quinone oxidoreductase subunit H
LLEKLSEIALSDFGLAVIKTVILLAAVMTSLLILIWVERKIVADMQARIGPNRAGPFGILQTMADAIKLFFKEEIIPARADKVAYVLAPAIALVPALIGFAVIPFGPDIEIAGRTIPLRVADFNIGVLYILAVSSLGVYGLALAGWSSNSKYSLLGGLRSSAQMVSYEVSMGLSIVAVVIAAGSLQLPEIVKAQSGYWFGFVPRWLAGPQFVALLIFFTCAVAETNRSPFDLPEAESELVGGFHTEYSSMKFAMFFLAEYTHVLLASALAVVLFFGGWHSPLPFAPLTAIPPVIWFLAKMFVVIFVYMWLRATFPRFRYDQLMRFGWKVLLPIALTNVILTGAWVALG